MLTNLVFRSFVILLAVAIIILAVFEFYIWRSHGYALDYRERQAQIEDFSN